MTSTVVLTKTHIHYPQLSSEAVFPSAALGFRIVFHSLWHTRVKEFDMSFQFLPGPGSTEAPIIKAMFPQFSSTGEATEVTNTTSTSGGLDIGFDPYVSICDLV